MRHRLAAALSLVALLALGRPATASPTVTVLAEGSGRTLVFLPWLGCPPEVWEGITDQLKDRFRCVRVGIGGFAGRGEPAALADGALVGAIGEVLAAEREPILIGHSFGGFLALQAAASFPDRLGGLVVVDAYPFPMGALAPAMTPEQARAQAQQVAAAFAQLPEATFRAQLEAAQTLGVRDSAARERIVEWMCRTDRTLYATCLASQLGGDLRGVLPGIRVPVLVIGTWATAQTIGWTEENTAQRLAEQYRGLPQVEIVVHPSARHFVMYDDPQGLAGSIEGFVNSHER